MTRSWVLVERADADDEDRERSEALAALLGAPLHHTDQPDDLDDVVADLPDGHGIVVCGGDGSLHHAANALYRGDALERVVLAVLPAGTGNDFAGHLDLPTEPEDVARLISGGAPRAIDLMALTCDDADLGVAVNAVHTGIGVDAAERAADLKDALGDIAYPVGSLRAGIGVTGWELTITADGDRVDLGEPILMAAVTNGATIGGGRPVAPDADSSDGSLDVMVSHSVGPAARAAFGVSLARGTHGQRDDVVTRRAGTVRIEGHEAKFNVDGELWEQALPRMQVRVLPGALRMVVPR